eukprot:4008739-Pyramimonas_sp.AAC.1
MTRSHCAERTSGKLESNGHSDRRRRRRRSHLEHRENERRKKKRKEEADRRRVQKVSSLRSRRRPKGPETCSSARSRKCCWRPSISHNWVRAVAEDLPGLEALLRDRSQVRRRSGRSRLLCSGSGGRAPRVAALIDLGVLSRRRRDMDRKIRRRPEGRLRRRRLLDRSE